MAWRFSAKNAEDETRDGGSLLHKPAVPLIRKKRYGNLVEQEYIAWLLPFVEAVTRLLKDSGSLVLDLGCCWERGRAVKSLRDAIGLGDD